MNWQYKMVADETDEWQSITINFPTHRLVASHLAENDYDRWPCSLKDFMYEVLIKSESGEVKQFQVEGYPQDIHFVAYEQDMGGK